MKCKPENKTCPMCDKSLNINTYIPGQGGNEPLESVKEGDITFCFSCRTVLTFNEDLNICLPEIQELFQIITDPDFVRFISEIDNARKFKPSLN